MSSKTEGKPREPSSENRAETKAEIETKCKRKANNVNKLEQKAIETKAQAKAKIESKTFRKPRQPISQSKGN